MEQEFYQCKVGIDYPEPIVDVDKTRQAASDIVWSYRKKDEVREEGKRILSKHVSNPSQFKTPRKGSGISAKKKTK
jgi:deoxyribodipyrimidine photo-lyase